ncbi:MAG: potassium transporter TrkA [Actinobacteria bacterium]|nr:potassium transporter TrkA [Actinomycetota bacterium]
MIVISLIIVLALSLICIRVATVALALTGLSEELARFQAQSAFFGVGFTTAESESVVSHPVRRRIISAVMIFGHAVFATAVSALILSFVNIEKEDIFLRMAYICGGVLILWMIFSSAWIGRRLSRLISLALRRWTKLDVRDYASLLRLSGRYTVTETLVEPKDWVVNKNLGELDLPGEGVLILGIQRADGSYIGAPTGKTRIYEKDTMILYGRQEALAEIDRRRAGHAGDNAHKKAVAKQQVVVKEQSQQEREQEKKHQLEQDKPPSKK